MAVICVVVVLGAWKLDVLPRSIMLVRFPRYFCYESAYNVNNAFFFVYHRILFN
jgi:hypothetical protein